MADLIQSLESSRVYYRENKQPPYLRSSSVDDDGGGKTTRLGGGGTNHTPASKRLDPTLLAAGGNAVDLQATASSSQQQQQQQQQPQHQQEADAAAGGGGVSSAGRRVSSFSLLPRVASVDTVGRPSLLQQQQQQSAGSSAQLGDLRRQQHGSGSDDRGGELSRQRERELENQRIDAVKPDWRLKDRMKTVGIGLVLALNVGTDPPDLTKPHPCAVLECWIDPSSVSRSKAKEIIGERLEQQYAKWQLARTARPLKYRRALDPTVEEVRALCLQLRRQARNERVLLHYNGHGVPRPTSNGEIWVFDKNHTEYTPLSIVDLRQWLGKPSIVVLDCSAAGILIPSFQALLGGTTNDGGDLPNSSRESSLDELASKSHSHWVNDTIALCPCSENQWLPMSADYPADIFTSCLTTPIPIALRWFVNNNPSSMAGLNPDAVGEIPGKANDRTTALGQLNWIFTAVTDSIAWNSLPKPLFQRLFRQDLLVASMFRNFLLADRILRSMGCTPVSYPPLPHTADHPLWRAWDLACETLLFQLMRDGILGNHLVVAKNNPPSMQHQQHQQAQPSSSSNDDDGRPAGDTAGADPGAAAPNPPTASSTSQQSPHQKIDPSSLSYSVSSPFFSEQLTAFQVWLDYSSIHKMRLAAGMALESPEQLPVVLQVLLSQTHRVRALMLLRRFLDLGPWAVNLSLSLGIFPYVMKLLQSPEYKSLLVSIWASILAFDPSCRVDLLKDGAFHHFVQHLLWGLSSSTSPAVTNMDVADAAKERTMAAYVLAAACREYPAGQAECVRLNLHGNCSALLSSYEQGEKTQDGTVELHLPAHFRLWLCMCLANMVKDNTATQNEAYTANVHTRLIARLNDIDSSVRTAVCYALGCLIGSQPTKGSRTPSSQDITSLQQQQMQMQQLQANQSGGIPAGLMSHQRIAAAPNMVVPPTGTSAAGIPNLHWRPQHLEPVQGMLGQQVPVQPAPQFMNQPVQLRPAQAQAMQAQYVMQGQPLQAGPPGFLVGGQPQLMAHQIQHHQQHPQHQQFLPDVSKQVRPTVFEDRRRLELDTLVFKALLKAIGDASVVVRYEATIALANAVGKYLDAFVIVAEESTASLPHLEERKFPRGLSRKLLAPFVDVWKALRSLQHDDPFPMVSRSSNRIVSFVHEHVLRSHMESDDVSDQKLEEMHSKKLARFLAGIDEEFSPPGGSGGPGLAVPSTPPTTGPVRRSQTTGRAKKKPELRRALSETVEGPASMEQNAIMTSGSSHSPSADLADLPMNFSLPKSEYYEWKASNFDTNFKSSDYDDEKASLDLMSPEGSAKAYQERRNFDVRVEGREIAARYASLAPKPPKPATKSIHMLLEEDSNEALEAAEELASRKKNELKLKENRVLRDEGVKMTSMIRFHPFENVIVSCGATDKISLWDTESGNRLVMFQNGNPTGSRITTSSWMNEESSSLFYVGCDDGTVRIWGDFLESNGQPSGRRPSLVSGFHALPMEAGRRGSGLVCEWQPFSGIMLAGGNSKFIGCWDLEAERQICRIETNTDANVTTLTTAWDYDQLGMRSVPQGYQGIGREIVVSGHSDGSLKVFDLRTHCKASELRGSSPQSQRPRRRPTGYSEHKSWVVAAAFTGYSSHYELVSGTLMGEIKNWDLRMSSSIRTIEAQRSTMTALAVHSKIPVVATGSNSQFIKVLTLDGDTLQVLRYHEKVATRIGPVSCLEFHRYKPLLAAGFADEYISLYTPKMRV